jgi:cyclopropane-fatty-acyl-phospholipid synthase
MAGHSLEPLGIPERERSKERPATIARPGPHALDRWIARKFMKAVGSPPLSLALWDGEEVYSPPDPVAGLRVHDRGALWRLVPHPDLAFGDLYSLGRITVEGELLTALEAVYKTMSELDRRNRMLRTVQRAILSTAPSLSRARANIHHHYDLGNDFYELWLDRDALQYTCAYYPESEMTLEQAQRAKMDHVCRKVWLRPGESVVEAGCGWGGFALHMAKYYDVTVRAYNISHEQIVYARAWAAREGLADRVEFVEDDFRNITGRYDVFVSIGMLEHVGPGNYSRLGRVIDGCLTPDGRGLIHSIGRDRPWPLNAWIRKRIFPGAYPPTLREMAQIFEPAGFSVLDTENLRLHYATTLREWLARYEQSLGRVREMFDDRFVRAWRLYLAGSIAGFTRGSLQLFQVLFARSGANAIPRSRARVYDDAIEKHVGESA